jgi:phosphate transport system substrate-binding protein
MTVGFLLLLATIIMPCQEAFAGPVVHIRGSTSLMPITQRVAESFMRDYPDALVTVSGGSTYRGIKSVVDGTAEIGMASSEMNEELQHYATASGVDLVQHIVAYDAIIAFVSPSNPVSGLSTEQLEKIYTGEIKNWQEVGGRDAPIDVTSLDPRTGGYESWKHLVLGPGVVMTPKAEIMEPKDMRAKVAKDANAIGFAGLLNADGSVKHLAVNGVFPTVENVTNKSYVLMRPLVLYTVKDASKGVLQFIEYYQAADKGQKAVKEKGLVPSNQE